ncbi:hypothetical protein [Methanococcus maripaludis]|uniref:Uncharacterized protein n=2 Tax=Methanococcus maripaludis TaxID=39152 RepID=A0A7J9PG14_METMI|nr:hypothetical protein [Methanococcus maripaludis]MBA2861610.1 hypothetical protein [Methanococcus maripaludis]
MGKFKECLEKNKILKCIILFVSILIFISIILVIYYGDASLLDKVLPRLEYITLFFMIISCIVSIFLAYMTLKNVIITQKHIEQEYEPIIIPDPTKPINCYFFSKNNLSLNEAKKFIETHLRLRNIGKYPAIPCNYRYSFEFEKFYEIIKQLNGELNFPLSLVQLLPSLNYDEVIAFFESGLTSKTIYFPQSQEQDYLIYYLLPEGTSNEGKYEGMTFRYYMIYYYTWLVLTTLKFSEKYKKYQYGIETIECPIEPVISFTYFDKLNIERSLKFILKSTAKIEKKLDGGKPRYNVSVRFYVNSPQETAKTTK